VSRTCSSTLLTDNTYPIDTRSFAKAVHLLVQAGLDSVLFEDQLLQHIVALCTDAVVSVRIVLAGLIKHILQDSTPNILLQTPTHLM